MKPWHAAILVTFSAMPAVLFAAQAYPVKLSAQDRELITAAACPEAGAKGAELIEATTAKRGSTSIDATVQCRSHRSQAAVPVAHHSSCHNRAGKWSCAAGYDALQVTIRKETVAVVAGDVQPAVAVDVVTRASKMTYPPFTEPAWPIFKGTCSVGIVPSPGRAGLTRYAIDCTGGKVELNKLCWKEGCTHFNVSGDRARP
jgi:uncharacterized cupin superfamily protein